MAASGIEDKKGFDWDEFEPAPDSSVRMVTPPPPAARSSAPPSTTTSSSPPRSSRPSVQIGSIRPIAQSSMSLTISFAVSSALMAQVAPGDWYLTVSRTDGAVLFEGALDEMGSLDVLVSVPCGTRTVKALLESSTKYRHAVVALVEGGTTTHTFV